MELTRASVHGHSKLLGELGRSAAAARVEAWGLAPGGEHGDSDGEAELAAAEVGHFSEAPAAPAGAEAAAALETVVDGRVRVYTDGAGRHNQDEAIRHAGSGAWWAEGHPYNICVPVRGPVTYQTNIRGELLALVLTVERDRRALEVCSDSRWALDRIEHDLAQWKRHGWRKGPNGARPEHVDLWRRLDRELSDAARGAVRFRWVKAHASEADVAAGRVARADKVGNDAADALAVAGAALHGVPPERVAAARRRALVARAVQRLMLDVAWERARARERLELASPGAELKDDEEPEPAAAAWGPAPGGGEEA
eukprot:gene19587-biopygen10791